MIPMSFEIVTTRIIDAGVQGKTNDSLAAAAAAAVAVAVAAATATVAAAVVAATITVAAAKTASGDHTCTEKK